MAAKCEAVLERRKKPKKKEITKFKQKFLVGQKVEVRNVGEGFEGSWNSAIVTGCDNFSGYVRYEHVLVDDGPAKPTQSIHVSSMIEGDNFDVETLKHHRGLIRPVPPPLVIHKWGLHYGLCVDVYQKGAWQEGVIFDYEDGFEERLVFFPDLSNQQTIGIEQLRITQDWNEESECWTPRKLWLFLELLEEHQQEQSVVVSARQVWHILRSKEEFENRIVNWTCRVRLLWDVWVMEAIQEHIQDVIDSQDGMDLVGRLKERRNDTSGIVSRGKGEEIQPLLALAEPDENVVSNPESDLLNSQVEECIPQLTLQNEENQSVSDLPSCSDSRTLAVMGNGNVGFSDDLMTEDYNFWKNIVDFSCKVIAGDNHGEFMQSRALSVLPSDEDTITCVSSGENGEMGAKNSFAQEVQALEAGGAALDAANSHESGEAFDNCMCSDEDLFTSLEFNAIDKGGHPINTLSGDDETQGIVAVQDTANGNKHLAPRRYGTWLPVGPDILPRAEYCPVALVNYLRSRSRNSDSTLLKARMHLSHMGWKIEFKKDSKFTRFRYISPDGQTKYSLRQVCKYLTEDTVKVQAQSYQNGPQSLFNETDDLLYSNVKEGGEGSFSTSRGESLMLDISKRKVVGPVNVASSPCLETLALDLPEREIAPPADFTPDVAVTEAEYCLQAVIDWCKIGSDRRKPKTGGISHLVSRAKKHLLSVGWKFWYTPKNNRSEIRYTSPKGRTYISLVTACKAYIEEGGIFGSMGPIHGLISGEESKGQLIGEFSPAIICTEVDGALARNGLSEKGYTESSGSSQSRELLEFDNVQVNNSCPLASGLVKSPISALSQTNQEGKFVAVSPNKRPVLSHNVTSQQLKKRKTSGALIKQRDQLDGSNRTCMLRSSKRPRQNVVPSTMHHTRTVLSCLIDNNVVLPRAKVYYKGRNDHRRLLEGRIAREGIRCYCCQKVFGLTNFEAHTGVTSRCPAANIFLEDGRSLLQCQKQMLHDNKLKSFASESRKRIKRNQPRSKTDYICSVCHYGGTLVLCDQCPAAFHLSCLGLEDLPEGQWFCPSCRCGICDQSEFNGDTEQFTEKTILYCDQCEHEYHVGCIRQRGVMKLESCPKGNWFCSKKCEAIFVGLHKLLGKPILVGGDNLSWTILKASKDDYCNLDASDSETMVEHHSKLNVALGVMHECFEPIKERYTKRDIVEDVLFNKWSELNRLNFWGFYTVLLERGDELISVATVRVYGEKVAEVPLVATRFQYRCQGMCRILMGVLEKKLTELGVERLLLPAVPQVLHTWTTSFGFSKLSSNERLKFLKYTFLDFQGTTMCQKILTKMPT